MAVKNIRKIKNYKPLFAKAFGNGDVTEDRIAKAIATFERSVISPPSKFDKFVSGKKDALTDAEVNGLHLFRTKANCINCHNTLISLIRNFIILGSPITEENMRISEDMWLPKKRRCRKV